jgi:hypothetical protein
MSGCGGKMMSKGGKVTPLKKKKVGGASESKGCPPGYYWSVQGCQKKDSSYKEPFSSTGAKIGVGIPLVGMIGAGVSAISKAIKAKKEKKKALTEKNTTPVEESKKRGGAKYKTGGIAKQTIVAFPGYNARTDTMKKGGATKNAKLAALAAPKNKITRADVIAGAIKNKRKRS